MVAARLYVYDDDTEIATVTFEEFDLYQVE